ncbi:MAG: hypothetical protein RBR32_03720 [Bacteroidales bacterium]|nr:hypothetical protein [Bacteroidales bacterium]
MVKIEVIEINKEDVVLNVKLLMQKDGTVIKDWTINVKKYETFNIQF